MKHIRIITASTQSQFRQISDFDFLHLTGVTLSVTASSIGTRSASAYPHVSFGEPGLVTQAIQAELDQCDAIVIESGGDTALKACRSAVSIPVVAMSESAMKLATILGRRFGVITAGKWHAQYIEDLACGYHLGPHMVKLSPIHLEPERLFTDKGTYIEDKLVDGAAPLIAQGADTIVFGGSYFLGYANRVAQRLSQQHQQEITVLDGLVCAIHFAKMLAEAGLSHNKSVYQAPAPLELVGYEGLTSLPIL